MSVINHHIREQSLQFQNEEDAFFQEIFELLQGKEKDDLDPLLRYIHLLLNEVFPQDSSETKTFHIHFEYNFDESSRFVIAQYLLIRLFKESNENSKSHSLDNEKLDQQKAKLRAIQSKLTFCPDGASGNKGNRIYKNWINEKKKVDSLIRFYDQLNNTEVFCNTVFNCQVSLANPLSKIFASKPYACEIENHDNFSTFNLLNTRSTLNEIDEIDSSVIDNLETVILFDCEKKKFMQHFSLQDISEFGIRLKKYLIITFSNKTDSFFYLRDKIKLLQDRFKIEHNDSYPITQFEIINSLGQKPKRFITVSFTGVEASDFWNEFILETKIHDLYELRSIKMMNLYSLCFNRGIKYYILHEIFSKKSSSNIISVETRQRFLDMRHEDLLSLKKTLENVLDLIIDSNVKQIIMDKMGYETVIVVDDLILNSKKLKDLISLSLLLTKNDKLASWSTFNNIENKSIIILSYQDQGKYPYHFYPNVVESTIKKNTVVEAIFQNFLFSHRHEWAEYNMAKDIYKLLDHPIRKKYFHWTKLKNSINSLRPRNEDDTIWNLERQYSGNSDRETIKLKLKNERERTFSCSELFIYSTDDLNYRVEKIGDIVETIGDEVNYSVHNLDSIQENINIYEKIIDTKQHQKELNIIRKQFNINNENDGRLWKILLKQKAQKLGEDILYDDLKKFLEKKGLKIVLLNHFKSNWINPESDSFAPLNKKVFKELCDFLELPKIYFMIIQRLRNASRLSTRQSTQQMNRLLQDLFNDGCFNDGANLSKIITSNLENYKKNHTLDELGIDESDLEDNLIALVELIIPEIKLKEIENFKKTEL